MAPGHCCPRRGQASGKPPCAAPGRNTAGSSRNAGGASTAPPHRGAQEPCSGRPPADFHRARTSRKHVNSGRPLVTHPFLTQTKRPSAGAGPRPGGENRQRRPAPVEAARSRSRAVRQGAEGVCAENTAAHVHGGAARCAGMVHLVEGDDLLTGREAWFSQK